MEIAMTELGYFPKSAIDTLAEVMDGKTYMNFKVKSSNQAGNHTIIVCTDYKASEEEVKNFFLSSLIAYYMKAKPRRRSR